jgi:hypothetical protein
MARPKKYVKVEGVKTNGECKGVPLNLNKRGTQHTNPDGSKDKVVKVGSEYFKKRVKGKQDKVVGSSYLFDNHLEFHGWLRCNGFAQIDIEEIDERWS